MAISPVVVTLVTWNARSHVRACLGSVLAQTIPPAAIRVIDNASRDGTADEVAAHFPSVELHRNARNEGYAAAQNRGAALAEGARYVFFLTPDVVLAPDHLEHLIQALDQDPGAASAGGKLLRPDGKTLDGAGIVAAANRHFRDRGQGETDDDRYTNSAVFAPCGAAVLHRQEALQDAAVRSEILDESFLAYKEDVDLAWRLRLRGWQILYVPEAEARHARAAPYTLGPSGTRRSLTALRRDRRALPPLVRRLSARNQLLLLVKNEHPRVLLSPDLFRILGRQLALLAYTLVLEPSTIPAYFGFLTRLPDALRRRLAFRRKVKYPECRSWFHRL